MKIDYKVNSKTIVSIDAKDEQDALTQLAKIVEIFGNDTCEKCKKNNIIPVVRVVDKYTYYEFKCKDCGAILQFGTSQEDKKLYPRRYEMDGTKPKLDADGNKCWLPDHGWIRWNGQEYV